MTDTNTIAAPDTAPETPEAKVKSLESTARRAVRAHIHDAESARAFARELMNQVFREHGLFGRELVDALAAEMSSSQATTHTAPAPAFDSNPLNPFAQIAQAVALLPALASR